VCYVLAIPVALVERILRLDRTHWAQTILYHGVRLCSLPLRLVSDVRLLGRCSISEGKAVIISNHHSYIDIALLFHIFPRIHMSARASLFRIPFLGWAMSLLQHFPHTVQDPESALRNGTAWLERGRFVGVFPEGTRSPTGEIGRFQSGAFRLAQRSTQLVQPVVVAGTGRVWARGQWWIRTLGPMAMKVIDPVVVPADLSVKELHALIRLTRTTMVEEHRRLEQQLFAPADLPPEDSASVILETQAHSRGGRTEQV
jgi:1-acyl-sn-glycerol-3-phosphate acyltransferase